MAYIMRHNVKRGGWYDADDAPASTKSINEKHIARKLCNAVLRLAQAGEDQFVSNGIVRKEGGCVYNVSLSHRFHRFSVNSVAQRLIDKQEVRGLNLNQMVYRLRKMINNLEIEGVIAVARNGRGIYALQMAKSGAISSTPGVKLRKYIRKQITHSEFNRHQVVDRRRHPMVLMNHSPHVSDILFGKNGFPFVYDRALAPRRFS